MDAIGFSIAMATLAWLAIGITVVVLARRLRGNPLDPTSGLAIPFGIATVAMLGSLTFSEVYNFTPCQLCWWQRYAMYPLSLLLGLALWRRDLRVRWIAVPLATVGAGISTWHVLIQRFPTLDGSTSCDPTAPCTAIWVEPFGIFTIPTMALTGFVAILVALLATSRTTQAAEADQVDGDATAHPSDTLEPEHA